MIAPDQTRPAKQRRGTVDSQAYDAYQKGRYAYFRYEPQAFVEVLSQSVNAAELDPDFANAYAQQAYCPTTLYVFGVRGSDKTLDAAVGLAREAIRRDDDAALGYARLGWVLGYLGRPQETIAAFDAALMRDPDNPEDSSPTVCGADPDLCRSMAAFLRSSWKSPPLLHIPDRLPEVSL